MTESEIYQLAGEAYCNGMAHGMQKSASFEKQALSPKLLLRALNVIAGKGDAARTMKMVGRIDPRCHGSLNALRNANATGALNKLQQDSLRTQATNWFTLGGRAGELERSIKGTMKNTSSLPGYNAAKATWEPYYNSEIENLIKL